MPSKSLLILVLLGLAACADQTVSNPPDTEADAAAFVAPPEGAAPNTCWGRQDTPNDVRVVAREIEVVPPEFAPDGSLARPGIYRTEQVRELVPQTEGALFELPCARARVPDFTASLQRALAIRGLYNGPANGRLNRETREAVRRYQSPLGINSAQVSLRMAEELGLARAAGV